jgi:hypothetical protein
VVLGEADGARRSRERHSLTEDAWHEVLAVGVGAGVARDGDGATEDVREEQDEDDGLHQ